MTLTSAFETQVLRIRIHPSIRCLVLIAIHSPTTSQGSVLLNPPSTSLLLVGTRRLHLSRQSREGNTKMPNLSMPLLIAIVMSCSCVADRRERPRFYSAVRCGLSVDEARGLADRYGDSRFTCGSPEGQREECTFSVGRNRVTLVFSGGHLETAEEGELFGITGMATRPRLSVCTGAQSRGVTLAPSDVRWVGATVSVDGEPIGLITTSAWQAGFYVPLGRHVLRVEQRGRDRFVKQITVPDGLVREDQVIELP